VGWQNPFFVVLLVNQPINRVSWLESEKFSMP
jgi:hypothetical protein